MSYLLLLYSLYESDCIHWTLFWHVVCCLLVVTCVKAQYTDTKVWTWVVCPEWTYLPVGSEGKATDLSFLSSAADRQFLTVFSSWSSHFSEPHWGTLQWIMKRAAIPLAWLTATAEDKHLVELNPEKHLRTTKTILLFSLLILIDQVKYSLSCFDFFPFCLSFVKIVFVIFFNQKCIGSLCFFHCIVYAEGINCF